MKLKRYDVGFCLDARESLDALRKDDGTLKRPLTKAESDFVTNECLMSKFDFEYWCTRYSTIMFDAVEGGGMGQLIPKESQQILLDKIARAEEEEYDKLDRGYPRDGILFHVDKGRQTYYTMICRALIMHRELLWHNMRAISASVDEDKIKELYDRDKLIYNCGLDKDDYTRKGGLPWWMRPELTFDVKADHMNFQVLNSSILYQFSTQGSATGEGKAAIGQGRQFDLWHGTEMAYWPESVLSKLQRDVFPTLPQSHTTLAFNESVAFGRSGWWYTTSKAIRAGKFARWRYCFIPYYAPMKKYRRHPPLEWQPDEVTLRHSDMVWETSIQYLGRRIRLDKEQLYWWETTREENRETNELASFLTNYCATPEEGFQHSNPTAVSFDTLSRLHDEANAARAIPYALRLGGTRSAEDDWAPKVPTHQIGKDALVPMHPDELDDDPRGIVWMWEQPKRSATYCMGIDTTNGLIPWDRSLRKGEDSDTDNGVIEVIRLGRDGAPDFQVAEYAAPIDHEALGDVANLLGRVYGGNSEDGQCLAITEVHLGMGLPTIRRMMDAGYLNHFVWQQIDKLQVTNTQSYGWYASPTAVRILWEKFRKQLALKGIRINSSFLVEELADILWDPFSKTANAASGKHDDRLRALALTQWASHGWGISPQLESTADVQKESKKKLDWQRSAVTWEQQSEEMEELVEGWLDP